MDGERREIERRLLEGVGPHGEEGKGPLDEGDVGIQLDVEMGREVDGLEGVAGAPGPTADLTGKQSVEVFEELFTPEIATNIVAQTNQYAQQYFEGHWLHLDAHPRARAHDFLRRPFVLDEIYRLLDLFKSLLQQAWYAFS